MLSSTFHASPHVILMTTPRTLVLKACSPDRQHQHHQELAGTANSWHLVQSYWVRHSEHGALNRAIPCFIYPIFTIIEVYAVSDFFHQKLDTLRASCFKNPALWLWCTLKCENHRLESSVIITTLQWTMEAQKGKMTVRVTWKVDTTRIESQQV